MGAPVDPEFTIQFLQSRGMPKDETNERLLNSRIYDFLRLLLKKVRVLEASLSDILGETPIIKDNHIYIPFTRQAPTYIPPTVPGRVAMIYEAGTSRGILWVHVNGSWRIH